MSAHSDSTWIAGIDIGSHTAKICVRTLRGEQPASFFLSLPIAPLLRESWLYAPVKRLLGLDLVNSIEAQSVVAQWSPTVQRQFDAFVDRLDVVEHRRLVAEAVANVLSALAQSAQRQLTGGAPLSKVVVTVRDHVGDTGRVDLRDAATLADLSVERVIREPTAAAIGAGLGRTSDERLVLVLDLGNQFNAVLLCIDDGVYELLTSVSERPASAGDDMTRRLASYLVQQYRFDGGDSALVDPQPFHEAAERAKCALSSVESTVVRIVLQSGRTWETVVQREVLEDLCGDIGDLVDDLVTKVMADAVATRGRPPDDVILYGGSSVMPMLRRRVLRHVGDVVRAPPQGVTAQQLCAYGAAMQAAILVTGATATPRLLCSFTLTTHTFAVRVFDGESFAMFPLFPRGTTVPGVKAAHFSTVAACQPSAAFDVYALVDGSDDLVSTLVATVMVDLASTGREDKGAIFEVWIDADADGTAYMGVSQVQPPSSVSTQSKPFSVLTLPTMGIVPDESATREGAHVKHVDADHVTAV